MNGIMNGDADRAFDNVMNSIYDKFVNAGREISAKFLEPIKAELLVRRTIRLVIKMVAFFLV